MKNLSLALIPYFPLPVFEFAGLAVDAWTLCVAAAFVLGVWIAEKVAALQGLRGGVIRGSSPWLILGGFTGAHWVHVLFYEPSLLKTPWSLLIIWSGLSSFGGFLGATLALSVYFRRRKSPFLPFIDALTLGFLPAWTLARVGCFMAHDHMGRLSSFFLAVDFPGGARHDLGLYEAIFSFLWSLIIFVYFKRRPPAGSITAWTCIAYSLFRFPMDFLRSTDLSDSDLRYGGLTFAQYGCIVLLTYGLWSLIQAQKRALVASPVQQMEAKEAEGSALKPEFGP